MLHGMDDNLDRIISDGYYSLSESISDANRKEDNSWEMSFVYEILY